LTQAPAPIPADFRAALGAQVYGCDICQDVCPWNRGVQKRRAGEPESAAGHVDLVRWLEQDGRELVDEYERLYVPRNDPRWLRRNAIVALGNVGTDDHRPLLERADDDEHAEWALAQLGARA
jgi:epoxyqueuosine reductase